MALIKCSECGQQVSSRALKCPHCGAPASGNPATILGMVAALMGALVFAGLLASRSGGADGLPPLATTAVGVGVVVIGLAMILVLRLRSGR